MPITNINRGDPSIANRYLADQLTPAEREAFEAQLLQDPAALRELEATARFKRGLEKLRESGKLDALVAGRSFGQRWWMSAAAAIAIFALTFGLLWRIESSPPMMASTVSSLVDREGHPLSVGATYALFRTRSTDHDAVITLPRERQAIELRVLPDSNMQPPYRVTLMSPGGGADGPDLTSVADLRPAEDGFVSVFIDSQRLAPGDYVVVVSGAGKEPGTQFLIRLNSSN
jgi:hypothetical protein